MDSNILPPDNWDKSKPYFAPSGEVVAHWISDKWVFYYTPKSIAEMVKPQHQSLFSREVLEPAYRKYLMESGSNSASDFFEFLLNQNK